MPSWCSQAARAGSRLSQRTSTWSVPNEERGICEYPTLFETFAAAGYETFATGTPEDLRALARRLECDYLLVDTETLWWSGRYILGVPYAKQVPDKGTCAWFFVNRNPAALTGVPGFELLYRSPPELQMDLFRVYRVR